jgi:hypothetical protein
MGIWVSLGVEGLEVLYDVESVLWVRYGIEWAVELALGWLDQSLPEPIYHHCLSVDIGNLALFDIDWVVLFQGGLVENISGDFLVKDDFAHDLGVGLEEAAVVILIL